MKYFVMFMALTVSGLVFAFSGEVGSTDNYCYFTDEHGRSNRAKCGSTYNGGGAYNNLEVVCGANPANPRGCKVGNLTGTVRADNNLKKNSRLRQSFSK